MTATYDAALAPASVGSAQFSLLRQLGLAGDVIGLSELSERPDLDRSTIGRNVRVLERMSLLQINDGFDKRKTTVELTASGRSVLESGMPLWEQAQRAFKTQMGIQEAHQLRSLLKAIQAPR